MLWDQYFAFPHGDLVFLAVTFVLAGLAIVLARTFVKKI